MAFAQLSSSSNYPWYLLREQHADLQVVRADAEEALPWDPGWNGSDALWSEAQRTTYLGRGVLEPSKLVGAVELSNFALFPHVRRFSSLSSLLRDLGSLGPEALAQDSAA